MILFLLLAVFGLDLRDYDAVPGRDCSEALQQAIDDSAERNEPVLIPPGTWKHDKNLYVHGAATIIGMGDSSILQVGDIESADGDKYAVIFGAKEFDGRSVPWTGSVRDLKVTAAPDSTMRGWCNLAGFREISFRYVTFDFRQHPSPHSIAHVIKGQNDNVWCRPGKRFDATIDHCKIYCHQSGESGGGEGFSITDCDGVSITHCYIWGLADDPIAVLGSRNVLIGSNRILTWDGRIKLSNTQRGRVIANHVERIADPRGIWSGSGVAIHAFTEADYFPTPADLAIASNLIIYPAEVGSFTYAIRLQGVDNATATGNLITSTDGNHGDIYFEAQRRPGRIIPCSNITIAGNILPAGRVMMTGNIPDMPGPFLVSANVASDIRVYGSAINQGNVIRPVPRPPKPIPSE